MQRVAAASRPTVNHRDDHLRHRANQTLHLKNVQAAAFGFHAGFIDGVRSVATCVLVTGAAANALVTARAKRPAAVLLGRTVAGKQDRSHGRVTTRMIQCAVQLIHSVGAKRVAHLRAVKRDADNAVFALRAHVAVIRNVRERFFGCRLPLGGVEGVGGGVLGGLVHRGDGTWAEPTESAPTPPRPGPAT